MNLGIATIRSLLTASFFGAIVKEERSLGPELSTIYTENHPQKDKLRNHGSLCSAGLVQDAIVRLNLHSTRFLLLEFHPVDERAMLGPENLSRQAAVCNARPVGLLSDPIEQCSH